MVFDSVVLMFDSFLPGRLIHSCTTLSVVCIHLPSKLDCLSLDVHLLLLPH